MALREALASSAELFVRQRKEWTEIVIDLETRNRYAVMDAAGETLGAVAEIATGFSAFLARVFLRSHRPLDVHVLERLLERGGCVRCGLHCVVCGHQD